jgi:hypothetical protein
MDRVSSNAVSYVPGYLPGEKPKNEAGQMMLAAARIKAEATAQHYPSGDWAFAERIEARVRTKELPSCRTEIGAGRELINREMVPSLVDTVEQPDYVAADASRHRLELADKASALEIALDAADSSNAKDSLEKMLVHEMAVIHAGMMKAAARLNEELHAAGVIDPNKREAGNVRACRLAGAISRMSATYQQGLLTLQRKRTGGNQHVTVKHIHQQVNVTEGGQAVVAGDKVTRGQGESYGGGSSKNEQ